MSEVLPPPPFPQNEAQIRAAVLEFHKHKKCFDKRPIKYMTISAISPMNAYRYNLEAVVERRVMSSKSVPYRDQTVPPSQPGPTDKWSIPCPTTPSTDPPGNAVVEFTETSTIIKCLWCQGVGFIICTECGGAGDRVIICGACHGDGYTYHGQKPVKCSECGGEGHTHCHKCRATGRLTCKHCEGQGSVVHWDTLVIKWTKDVHTFDTPRGGGDLSSDLLAKCTPSSTTELSRKSTPEDIKPLEFPADPEILKIAEKAIPEMIGGQKEDTKIVSFTQIVMGVPVVKVDFKWKGKVGKFYVYGTDEQVHFPNIYPGCCGCCGSLTLCSCGCGCRKSKKSKLCSKSKSCCSIV